MKDYKQICIKSGELNSIFVLSTLYFQSGLKALNHRLTHTLNLLDQQLRQLLSKCDIGNNVQVTAYTYLTKLHM